MIASLSLETVQDPQYLRKYVTDKTCLWAISKGVDLPNVEIHENLFLPKECIKILRSLAKIKQDTWDGFKEHVVPVYLNYLMSNPNAIEDLRDIARAAQHRRIEIALVDKEWCEFVSVKSVIIGIFQGAGIVVEYLQDMCTQPYDYSYYYDLLTDDQKRIINKMKIKPRKRRSKKSTEVA